MSTRAYQIWMLVMVNAFVLTLYRPSGFFVFMGWAGIYVWLVLKRAAMIGQMKEGRVAAIAGIVGGLGLQGVAINIQMNVFPEYLARTFAILGVVGFGIAVLFSVSLVRGWYAT